MQTDHHLRSSSWIWLLFLFSLASFMEASFYGQMGAFTPLYLPRLGISQTEVAVWTGRIVAISGLVGIPFLPFWGALADRYARQPVIVRSFVVHFLAALVSMLAGNIWVFLAGRSLMSLSLGNTGLMLATLAESAPDRRQGLAFAIMNSAAPVGVFLGPLYGGFIVDRWGFQSLLGFNAVLMLLVTLAMALGYRDTYRPRVKLPLLRMAAGSVGIVLRSARLWTLFLALTVLMSGWLMGSTFAPISVVARSTGQSPGSLVGLVIGAGGLAAILISPLIGALADRFGLWKVLISATLLEVVLWPIPAVMAGLVAFGIAWALLSGVASGNFAISVSALSRSTTTGTRGRVMSFAYLPVNIGSVIGPAIGSYVAVLQVDYVYPTAAAITLVGAFLLMLSSRQPVGVETSA
jgi:DHA1 family multidrug resistance protein-like MFS transporter